MKPAELYYFIGKCLSMDDDPQARRAVEAIISAGKVPWEDFVWMGSSHLVLPALYSVFGRNGVLPMLPADLADYLSEIHALNRDRNLKILAQSHELIRILNGAGIEPVFLKGAGHLLQELYPDNGDRIMSDIDILLSQEDLAKAACLLYENGYFHPDEFNDDNFEKHHHLPGFEHRDKIAMVEIHHSLFPGRYSKLISNAEIATEKRKLDGIDAWVLSYRHQVALNFVHDQLVDDGFKYKAMVIKGLYDFFLMAKNEPEQNATSILSGFNRKFNAYSFFASALFNHSQMIHYKSDFSAIRFKKQFDYLLNHPKMQAGYQLLVLNSLRLSEVLKVLFTAPFSRTSRRYILKKAGNTTKVKQYIRKLMRGE